MTDRVGASPWVGGSRSWTPWIAGAIAVAVSALAVLEPISAYDGGIAASSATFTLHGRLPYADYWLLYGPLSGFLLAVPTAVVGPSVEVLRVAGLIAVAVQAGFGAALLARWTYPVAAVGAAVMATILPAAMMGLELGTWAMAMALAMIGLWLRLTGRSPLLAGIVVGLTFATRLDVGGYLLIALLLLPDRRDLILGFGSVAIPLVLFVLATAPSEALIEQLIWFPLIGQREFRNLPGLESQMHGAELIVKTLGVVLLPRLALVAGAIRAYRVRSRSAWALVLFASLCQLQALARGDEAHFAMAATPALLLLGLWAGPTRASGTLRGRLPSVLVTAAVASLISATFTLGVKGVLDRGDTADASLRSSVAVIQAITIRDDPIFAAQTSNRFTYMNPTIAYYLADRPSGSTKTMFNPGVTNTDAVQQTIVDQLEHSATNVLILENTFATRFDPENESRTPGSTVLDAYIAARFRTLCDFSDHRVAVRRDAAGMPDTCPTR